MQAGGAGSKTRTTHESVALRLTSPFIIAIAIDQKMAHHVAYPYIKGAAAFTLIAPAVGAIVAIFAYAAANVPLSATDERLRHCGSK